MLQQLKNRIAIALLAAGCFACLANAARPLASAASAGQAALGKPGAGSAQINGNGQAAKQAASGQAKPQPALSAGERSSVEGCKEGSDLSSNWWTMLFTGISALVALAALVVAIVQAYMFRNQLRIMQSQIDAAHHPDINVTNVVIYPEGASDSAAPTLVPGERISGYAYAVNVGPAIATIDTSQTNFCQAYWLRRLPMFRPYNSDKPDRSKFLRKHESVAQPEGPPVVTLASGEFGSWRFSTVVPSDRRATLYVMGTIFHRDAINARHATLFCRRFNRRSQSFEVVENRDYECKE